jgi:hypothetical protein
MRKVVCLVTVVLVVSVLSSVYAADDCNVVRYVDNLDGTMTDCRSNLTWLKDANCTATINSVTPSDIFGIPWYDATEWVKGLKSGICGLTVAEGSSEGDWRLPTKTEWMAMIISAKKQGFTSPVFTTYQGTGQWGVPTVQGYDFHNVRSGHYWSSTTDAAGGTGGVWCVDIANGGVSVTPKTGARFAWPVRGGRSASFDTLTLE